MLRLLHIEFYKLKHSRSSKILTLAYFIILSFIALIASVEFNFGDIKVSVADMGIFNFPVIWHFTTYIAAFLKFFLAIVIVSMMSNEYSNRTLKQNLIDGLSKKEFVLSKFYAVIVFSLLSSIFVFVLTIILGYSFSDYTELSIVTRELDFIFAYFLKLVAFFSFCLFLGVLVKRSAFALGFYSSGGSRKILPTEYFAGSWARKHQNLFYSFSAGSDVKSNRSPMGTSQFCERGSKSVTGRYRSGLCPALV